MSSSSSAVPSRHHLRPGTPVNIVLKADQRTGKLTFGQISDILTSSGDHPRGIKVRLGDGRIGRVQSLGSGGADGSPMSPQQQEMLGEQAAVGGELAYARGAEVGMRSSVVTGLGTKRQEWKMQDDVRDDPVPAEERSLDAYIKVPSRNKGKKGRKKAGGLSDGGTGVDTTTQEAAVGLGEDGSGSGARERGLDTSSRESGLVEEEEGGKLRQEQLEKEYPRLDSALIAAIVADLEGLEGAREVLKGLS